MKDEDRNKSEAIRVILGRSKTPITMEVLLPRMERRLKMLVSAPRLYTLLSVMQNAGEITSTGRGSNRAYELAR